MKWLFCNIPNQFELKRQWIWVYLVFCQLWRKNCLTEFVWTKYFIYNLCLPVCVYIWISVCKTWFAAHTKHFVHNWVYLQLCIHMIFERLWKIFKTQFTNAQLEMTPALILIQNSSYAFKSLNSTHQYTEKYIFMHRSKLQQYKELWFVLRWCVWMLLEFWLITIFLPAIFDFDCE